MIKIKTRSLSTQKQNKKKQKLSLKWPAAHVTRWTNWYRLIHRSDTWKRHDYFDVCFLILFFYLHHGRNFYLVGFQILAAEIKTDFNPRRKSKLRFLPVGFKSCQYRSQFQILLREKSQSGASLKWIF